MLFRCELAQTLGLALLLEPSLLALPLRRQTSLGLGLFGALFLFGAQGLLLLLVLLALAAETLGFLFARRLQPLLLLQALELGAFLLAALLLALFVAQRLQALFLALGLEQLLLLVPQRLGALLLARSLFALLFPERLQLLLLARRLLPLPLRELLLRQFGSFAGTGF